MKEQFEDMPKQDAGKESRREKFEDLVDELGVSPVEFTSFYARKITKMPHLEMGTFENAIGYARFRMGRKEWDKAYYYLNFVFFDAFRDSENKEKNNRRNEIIDLMNECLEKLRIKEEENK